MILWFRILNSGDKNTQASKQIERERSKKHCQMPKGRDRRQREENIN